MSLLNDPNYTDCPATPETVILGLDDDEKDPVYIVQYVQTNAEGKAPENSNVWEGPTLTLTKNQAHHSRLLDAIIREDNQAEVIPVFSSSMSESAWRRCMDYLIHHGNSPITIPAKPLKHDDLKMVWEDPWDVDFIDTIFEECKDRQPLYDFIRACDYLDISPGVILGCTKLASVVRGHKIGDLDALLGLA